MRACVCIGILLIIHKHTLCVCVCVFIYISVLNIHWKDWCWSWNLQYCGHLMRRTDSLIKTLKLGKVDGWRKWGWQRISQQGSPLLVFNKSCVHEQEGVGRLSKFSTNPASRILLLFEYKCLYFLIAQLVKKLPAMQEALFDSFPGSGRSAGEGIGYPLQYSGLENSMDCIVHGFAKSWTRLNDFHFHMLWSEVKWSRSIVSDSLRPHGL